MRCVELQRLLEEGVSADARDESGYPALCRAAEKGHLDILKLLQAKGACLEARDLCENY